MRVLSVSLTHSSSGLLIESEIELPIAGLGNFLAIRCLDHQSPHVRIAATSIIVIADGTAASFRDKDLHALRPALEMFFSETDARIRGDLFNILKKLTSRLVLVINRLEKGLVNVRADVVHDQRSADTNSCILTQHKQFVEWFYNFLYTEMRPSASYQRHLMGLKTLNMESTLELLHTCKVGPLHTNHSILIKTFRLS